MKKFVLFLLFMPLNVLAASEAKTIGQGAAPVSSVGLLQWILSCIMVIGIMIACLWLLKKSKLAPGGKNDFLKVIAWISVSRTDRILVVKAGSRYLLLGATAESINLLSELSEDEVQESLKSNSSSSSFASRLQEALAGKFMRGSNKSDNADQQDTQTQRKDEGEEG